jgi:GxxExxY protein
VRVPGEIESTYEIWGATTDSAHGWLVVEFRKISRKGAKDAKEDKKMVEEEIGRKIVDGAIRVHRELGPGLLETVYEGVFAHELAKRGLRVDRQVVVPLFYEGLRFDEAFRVDLFVENRVIVEIKCVEKLSYAHKKQLLTYLRLAGIRLGYLLNFGEALMKDGITRTVHGFPGLTP